MAENITAFITSIIAMLPKPVLVGIVVVIALLIAAYDSQQQSKKQAAEEAARRARMRNRGVKKHDDGAR